MIEYDLEKRSFHPKSAKIILRLPFFQSSGALVLEKAKLLKESIGEGFLVMLVSTL